VTHHGLANSGADALVHGVRPRVAVMQNGTRKGGSVQALEIMRKSPGLEDIWQLHWSYHAGIEHNPAGVFIANVDDAATIANVLTSPPPAGRGGGRGAGGPGAGDARPPVTPGGTAGATLDATPSSTPGAAVPSPSGAAQTGSPGSQPPSSSTQSPAPRAVPAQAPAGPPPGSGRGGAAAAHTPAYYLKISAQADGAFTVTNTRNGFSKTYTKRAGS